MNRSHTVRELLLIRSKPTYLIIFFLIAIAGIYSCKNKKGNSCNLSLNDSLAIAHISVSQHLDSFLKGGADYEKISYLTFTVDQQKQILVDTSIKQIKFSLADLGGNAWGLDAWGITSNGVQKTGPVRLSPSDYPAVINIYRLAHSDIYLSRGGLKALLGLPTGTNDPIKGTALQPLIFSPSQSSDATRLFKIYYDCLNSQSGILRAINPSPPAGTPCTTHCDD